MTTGNHPLLPLSDTSSIGVLEDGREIVMPIRELCARLQVDALIRLHEQDFRFLERERTSFVHFNLEFTLNEVGRDYAIVPIVIAGRRSATGSEVLPVINPSFARRGVCTEVIQHLPIEAVTSEQFADSLPNVRTAKELGDALLRRYQQMFPEKSPQDLLDRGCALTRLSLTC